MKRLRIGVIGTGHLGYHHARLYKTIPNLELVGIADTGAAARQRVAQDFAVPAYADYEELLNQDLDAVSVATPTHTHKDVALAAISKGVHVLVEKPIASTPDEARAMTTAAKEKHVILQVGHVERFNGAVLALFKSDIKPSFIECHRLSPFSGRSSDVSVVLDLMIHDLDIILQLTQSEPVQVDASGVPIFSEQEDIANARLRFASGCVANLTSSRVSMEAMRKIRIFDPNAYISTDYSAQQVLVYRKKPGPLPKDGNFMEHISVTPIPVHKEEPLRLELTAFIDAVRFDAAPNVSGDDGLHALELSWRILEAIRNSP